MIFPCGGGGRWIGDWNSPPHFGYHFFQYLGPEKLKNYLMVPSNLFTLPNLTSVNISASILFAAIFCCGAENVHYIFFLIVPELHCLNVLFGMNLLSNISTTNDI